CRRAFRGGSGRIVSLDPALIAAVDDGAPPPLILQIPLKGAAQTRFEAHPRPVPELALDLAAINRVAAVVSGTVPHELNEARTAAAPRSRTTRESRAKIMARAERFVRH